MTWALSGVRLCTVRVQIFSAIKDSSSDSPILFNSTPAIGSDMSRAVAVMVLTRRGSDWLIQTLVGPRLRVSRLTIASVWAICSVVSCLT